MSNLLREQQTAPHKNAASRPVAASPKPVFEYFKDHIANKLLGLCGIINKADLPELSTKLHAANGKREHKVVKEYLQEVANGLVIPELTPVVTRLMVRKITALRLSKTNREDLSKDINPFSMIIMDHTTSSGSQAYNDAMAVLHNNGNIFCGSGVVYLSNLKALDVGNKNSYS